jgi:hypothetical protein
MATITLTLALEGGTSSSCKGGDATSLASGDGDLSASFASAKVAHAKGLKKTRKEIKQRKNLIFQPESPKDKISPP